MFPGGLDIAWALLFLSVTAAVATAILGPLTVHRERRRARELQALEDRLDEMAREPVEAITRDIEIVVVPDPPTRRAARRSVIDRAFMWSLPKRRKG